MQKIHIYSIFMLEFISINSIMKHALSFDLPHGKIA